MTTETATTGTNVIEALIQRLVTLDEEYDEIAKPIEAARKAQRDILRDTMIEAQIIEHVDETTGYRALLTAQQRDEYVPEKLLPLLPRPELADTIFQTIVDPKAIQDLVDGGMLTRRQLEQAGALLRGPKTKPYVKLIPLKGARP